jgi:NAD(P)H-hydrate epimerase
VRVLNTSQMREADRRTIEDLGVPSLRLMEAAGREVVAVLEGAFPGLPGRRIAVVCGRGNNGGDGFVVARLVAERGAATRVLLVGRAADVTGDARVTLEALQARGVEVVQVEDESGWEATRTGLASSDLIVDAILGTGLRAAASGQASAAIEAVNAAGRPVVSIDLPSGLDASTSATVGPTVRAAITVALAAPKVPLVLPPAESFAGRIEVVDIGIPQAVIDDLPGPWLEVTTRDIVRARIPVRDPGAHKGTFRHVLVVAGSRGKSGAAFLAAMGALRSGAGLVTIATPGSVLPIVASLGAEFMTIALPENADGAAARRAVEQVLAAPGDIIAIGPGLGQSPDTVAFVRRLLDEARVPMVIDADALNACADTPETLRGRDDRPLIVTPHPGEMARLVGTSAANVQGRRLEVARAFASERSLHVLLKGARTIVAAPDGRACINQTGNPGMATGGTGDVLTGAVAAWWAQLGDPFAAAQIAAYLHGYAGDLAAQQEGEVGLIAGDVARALARAALDIAPPQRASTGVSLLARHRAHSREP